jgi:hypothetical protein
MSDESTNPDLVERWRRTVEAGLPRDFDAAMSVYAPDAVWGASLSGVGSFEGVIANRSLRVQAVGLDPDRGGLALAGRAAPLARTALAVGSGEAPLAMLAAREAGARRA